MPIYSNLARSSGDSWKRRQPKIRDRPCDVVPRTRPTHSQSPRRILLLLLSSICYPDDLSPVLGTHKRSRTCGFASCGYREADRRPALRCDMVHRRPSIIQRHVPVIAHSACNITKHRRLLDRVNNPCFVALSYFCIYWLKGYEFGPVVRKLTADRTIKERRYVSFNLIETRLCLILEN